MADLPALPAWGFAHAAIGVSATWLALRYARRRKLIDQPGERRSHRVATPRGGGIAIVVVALMALAWLAAAHALSISTAVGIGSGLAMVAGIGWFDDHRPLSPWLRLAVQAVSGLVVAITLIQEGHGAATAASGFLMVMVLVNVWNFMDGIDGLAASQALLVAAGWAWLAWPHPWAWMLVAVAAGCLGFLPFNLPTARIFLGDVGSGALGYLLAIGLLWLPVDALRWPWLAWLPLSTFLVDATLTLSLRILRREHWWTPHLQHAYQRWAARCGRHAPVSVAYALWTACCVLIMVSARGMGAKVGTVVLVAGYALAALAWAWLGRSGDTRVGSAET